MSAEGTSIFQPSAVTDRRYSSETAAESYSSVENQPKSATDSYCSAADSGSFPVSSYFPVKKSPLSGKKSYKSVVD